MNIDSLVKLFILVDDFCKKVIPIWNKYLKNYNNSSHCISDGDDSNNGNINNKVKKIYRHRKDTLTESEIMTILLMHQSVCRNKDFKTFYNGNREILL